MTTREIIKHLFVFVFSVISIFFVMYLFGGDGNYRVVNSIAFGFFIFPFYSLMKLAFCLFCTCAYIANDKGIVKSWSYFEEEMFKKYSWKRDK